MFPRVFWCRLAVFAALALGQLSTAAGLQSRIKLLDE